MADDRNPQLAYSDTQPLMLDEPSRRLKAAKMAAVIQHFLGRDGRDGLDELTILDVGCSGGIIADEPSQAYQPATNRVLHDSDNPSRLVLPIIRDDHHNQAAELPRRR